MITLDHFALIYLPPEKPSVTSPHHYPACVRLFPCTSFCSFLFFSHERQVIFLCSVLGQALSQRPRLLFLLAQHHPHVMQEHRGLFFHLRRSAHTPPSAVLQHSQPTEQTLWGPVGITEEGWFFFIVVLFCLEERRFWSWLFLIQLRKQKCANGCWLQGWGTPVPFSLQLYPTYKTGLDLWKNAFPKIGSTFKWLNQRAASIERIRWCPLALESQWKQPQDKTGSGQGMACLAA